jgi:WD40 repeat protein
MADEPTIPQEPTDDPERRRRFEAALGAYFEAIDAGQTPDRQELMARHPDLATELTEFFAEQERFHRLVAPLRPEATEPAGSPTRHPGGLTELRVRDPETSATLPLEEDADSPAEMQAQPSATVGGSPEPAQANGVRIDLPRGTRVRYFGDYELIKELGRGGMGIVYRARQVSLNRPIALKMVKAGVLADGDELRRFQNEAEAIALLDHPGIVPVYEVGEYESQKYFSMKLVPGGNLAEKLPAYRHEPRVAAALLAEVAEAVHHAHMRGILHRDLKPANILLDEAGHPHVTDFGLARKVEGDSELTATGAILGTPSYMAPEQASGKRGSITTATDVYGLGAVLYATLTGQAPFAGDSAMDTLQMVRERAPEPPRKFNAQVPRDLEVICLKCLEKDPLRRYSSAQAMAEDLRAWLNSRPITARPVGPLTRGWLWCRRHPAIAGLSAALALVTLAGLVAAGTQWRAAVRNAVQAEANARLARDHEQEALRRGESLARSNRQLRLAGYASAMQLAQREWEQGNISNARALLAKLRPAAGEIDLRGFEWHYLRRQCEGGALTLDLPPSLVELRSSEWRFDLSRVSRIDFSPDGSRLLAVIRGRILAWELPSGRVLSLLKNATRGVIDARFSPGGKRLGVVAVDLAPEQYIGPDGRAHDASASLEIWELASGKRLRATELAKAYGGNLAFRPDGRQAAVRLEKSIKSETEKDNQVLIVDVESGRLLRTQFEVNSINEALTYSPDGSLLVGPGPDPKLNIWDSETGQVRWTVDPKERTVRDVAFRPDGARLAVAGDSGLVTVWSLPRWELLQSLRVSEQHARRCRFSSDGSSLATMGFNSIKLWDGTTGEYRFLIRGASCELAFTPDGARIAAAGDAATTSPVAVQFWDARQEQGALVHKGKTSLGHCRFSADGRRVVDSEGTILDASTGATLRTLPILADQEDARLLFPVSPVLSPDGKQTIFLRNNPPLVGGLADTRTRTGDLILWDVDAAREVKRLSKIRFPECLEVSSDGRWLLTLQHPEGDDSWTRRELTVRDATTWEPVFTRKDPPVYGNHAVFSNGSKSILLGQENRVVLIEVPSGRELKTYGPLPSRPLSMALSPDGRWAAAAVSELGVGDLTVHIWDAASGAQVQVIPQTAEETVTTLSFSPDGRRLTSAGFNAKVKIWDTESGLELLTLAGHTSWIWATSFSPDGRRIISCGRVRTVRIWDATPLPREATNPP